MSITITARRASPAAGSSNSHRSSSPGNSGSSGRNASPRPCRRRIRGGPSNAHSITTMRPFSRRCAIVSAPLPTTSRYATVWPSSTRSVPIGPFGDRLTWPSSPRGAVATKNSRWRAIQARWCSSIRSYTRPTAATLADPVRFERPRELADEALLHRHLDRLRGDRVDELREVALAPAAQLAVEPVEPAVLAQHEPGLVAARLFEVLAFDRAHDPAAHRGRLPERRALRRPRAREARAAGGSHRGEEGGGRLGAAGLERSRVALPFRPRREPFDRGEVAAAGGAEHAAGRLAAVRADARARIHRGPTLAARAAHAATASVRSRQATAKASTTEGSNCVQAQRSSSSSAASGVRCVEYGRGLVIASNASATATIRAPSGISGPASASG